MRDDLNAIPVFVTVVESGNFASAAAILHVTRSAVGKTIARLEARLGVALFQRTTRRQLLTEEGEQFYRQCREALERIREAEETLQRGKDEVQGRLRVSLPVLFGQRCVAPLLFRLSQRYPLLKLELHYSDRQVNLLEEGFDLAVRIGSLADTGSLRARALGEHGMVLCAAAEYLRQQPAPQTIAGLNEHRTLGYLHNGQLQKWQLYDPQQGEVRFSPQTWLIQDDFAAIAAAVQQGMGIAWLPDWLVAQALADGTLQQVLAPSAQVRFAIHAVWPEGPWLPQKRGRRSMPCGKGCLLRPIYPTAVKGVLRRPGDNDRKMTTESSRYERPGNPESICFSRPECAAWRRGRLTVAGPFLRHWHRVYDAGDRARPVVPRWP